MSRLIPVTTLSDGSLEFSLKFEGLLKSYFCAEKEHRNKVLELIQTCAQKQNPPAKNGDRRKA